MSQEKIHIIIPSSDFYMPYTLVMITSLVVNKRKDDNLFIHIITEDVTESSVNSLKDITSYGDFEFEIVKLDKKLIKDIDSCVQTRIGNICNYKLFISKIFDFNKAIVLEGDMIVLRSLKDLYNFPLDDSPMAAVKDPICNEIQGNFDIPPQYRYCNTGMFLANLEYWRKNNSVNKFLHIARDFKGKLLLPDQDIFNIAFYKEIKYLPLGYNVYASVWRHNFPDEQKEADKKPIIIHWADFRKPWEYLYLKYAFLFWKYAKLSPCYEIILSRMSDEQKDYIKDFPNNYINERKRISHKLLIKRIRYAFFHRKKDKQKIKELKKILRRYNV